MKKRQQMKEKQQMKGRMFSSIYQAILYVMLIFLSTFFSICYDMSIEAGSIYLVTMIASLVLLFEYGQLLWANRKMSKVLSVECYIVIFSLIVLFIISFFRFAVGTSLKYTFEYLWQLLFLLPVLVVTAIELVAIFFADYHERSRPPQVPSYVYADGVISSAAKTV